MASKRLTDLQALALRDQIIAAFEDDSPGSLQIFNDLTTQAVVNMSKEQWQTVAAEMERRKFGAEYFPF
jgi:hypothetical protein